MDEQNEQTELEKEAQLIAQNATVPVKRVRKPKGDALRDAYMATSRQSEAARLVGMRGSAFRDVTRDDLASYVSKGAVWDAPLKAASYALIVTHKGDRPAQIKAANAYRARTGKPKHPATPKA